MVIKALYDAWRSGQVMRHMYGELLEMLASTQWMFESVGKVLFEGLDPDEIRDELYDTDRMVNKCERRIRKEIVEHLSIRPRVELPACLVLMSVIKDAERVGDYCKNLFELRDLLGETFSEDEMTGRMRDAHTQALDTFGKTQKSLREGDEDLARALLGGEKKIAYGIEKLVKEVAESEVPVLRAVCQALFLRHIKRVNAHLINIASSVVQPVHRIDYQEKKRLGDDE